MSVIVKGMAMPKSCSKCRWFDMGGGYGYQCTLLHKSFDMWNKISVARDKECPLIELPPHGRLIDADKLKSRLVLDNESSELQRISADILKWIDIQETVIEGSEA